LLKRKLQIIPQTQLTSYIVALVIGILVGLKVIPANVTAILYLLLAVACIFKCIKRDVPGFLSLLPYLMYTEVFVRAFTRWVPYLTLEYLNITCFSILLINGVRLRKNHSIAFFSLVLYTAFELINNIYPDKAIIGRAILTNSFALLIPVIWASFNILNPAVINRFFRNIKIASIFLSAVVLAAHLTGKIDYGLYSNSDASNGMAPVQLSAYLGFACILFFLSIINPQELNNRLLNILLLAFSATLMLLTFSRGGLYFLGAVIALYLFYNRAKMGSYLKILIFIPIGLFIYMYVVNQTQGKILQRYEQEGTSERDVLASIGFIIFFEHPIFGVGTGNYNTTIYKEKLFPVESGAHNEFVRAAAEHGIVGIILYWSFYCLLFAEILRRKPIQKQYGMYFFVLFCLIIIHNGLKISIQPLILVVVIATPTIAYKRQRYVYDKELEERSVA
jgi:O-antigen ligase